jgi:ribosomal protein S18 acetylase RimI-like enzyme
MDKASHKIIQTIEEISLNAWPSLQQILYDGWILRFASGHTKRANSVNPVYTGNINVYKKIERCEQIYIDKKLQPVFRITPLAYPENLDQILAKAGFEKKDLVSVQVMDLISFQPQAPYSIRFWEEFSLDWLDNFANLSGVSKQQEALAGILGNIASRKCFAVLLKDNRVVSCGLGVLENQYIGIFEIVTAKPERRKGYGKELLYNILGWAKHNGAKKAYLQVAVNNRPAFNLCSKLGFQGIYQYFYRIKIT